MTSGSGDIAVMDVVDDVPMTPQVHATPGDRIFRTMSTSAACVSLVLVGGTLVFLILKSRPAFAKSGIINFFTKSVWNPSFGQFGVFGLLVGTLIIATVAMVIAVPLGVAMALFINEYAPARLRGLLTSIVDLLAALPSLLFGIWAVFALQSHLTPVAGFLGNHFSAIPFMRLDAGDGPIPTRTSFLAGCVVAIMILPIITSVTRDVMAQVPREQCEGALALGGTRWGMIREVILPFARGGIVGASLLGFGRALGETIAVALIIIPTINANTHIFTSGSSSVAGHIAIHFGEAGPAERSGLVAAGLALFLLTLVVNLLARMIVVRKARASAR